MAEETPAKLFSRLLLGELSSSSLPELEKTVAKEIPWLKWVEMLAHLWDNVRF